MGVVTQPDRARGRGQKSQPGPVKESRERHGVAVASARAASRRGVPRRAARLACRSRRCRGIRQDPDATTCCETPRLGLINVHASLLPKYRGAAPIHRAVMAGDAETGVTIMRVVKALDAGPMIAKVSASDRRARNQRRRGARYRRDRRARARRAPLTRSQKGAPPKTPQDESEATYAPKIEKSDGIVDWSRPAREIHNQIRGLHPWPHAYSELEGERTILLKSEVERETVHARDGPGTIVEATWRPVARRTGRGVLRLLTLAA